MSVRAAPTYVTQAKSSIKEDDEESLMPHRALSDANSTRRNQKICTDWISPIGLLSIASCVLLMYMLQFSRVRLAVCEASLDLHNTANNSSAAAVAVFPADWEKIAHAVRSSMNDSVDPCEDFYQYACGGWLSSSAATIPLDRSSWSRSFGVLDLEAEQLEMQIVTDEFPLVTTFFDACVDTKSMDELGHTPITPLLEKIGMIVDAQTLTSALALLWMSGIEPLFEFGVEVDSAHPHSMIAAFDQGGITLPVSYYTSNDTHSIKALQALEELAFELLRLLPTPFNETPVFSAREVINFETKLAAISMSSVERRDPVALYNRLSPHRLQNLTASIRFGSFIAQLGVEKETRENDVNVHALRFFRALDEALDASINTSDFRNFMAFKVVESAAGLLSREFRDAVFKFHQKISGVAEQAPRRTQCVREMDSTQLGFVVGHIFVAQHFPPRVRNATQELVNEIEEAFASRLHEVTWLDVSTRALARDKLLKLVNKIGYPNVWERLDDVRFRANRHYENVASLIKHSRLKDVNRIGAPVDRELWEMLPQEVNAYYAPDRNEMVFPAAILRSPFYNIEAPGAMNYGGIGSVIGHELHHGFDDEGRQFDANGTLSPWWNEEVVRRFQRAIQCVGRLYDAMSITIGDKSYHLNGNLTMGENLADIGGVGIAYRAYTQKKRVHRMFSEREALIPLAFNMTSSQLYFVAWAQNECAKTRDATAASRLASEPHAPAEARVLGPASQTAAFAEAFQCRAGTRYNPLTRCSVW